MTKERYQVFVSSTSQDLVDARRTVFTQLVETGCTPISLELSPKEHRSMALVRRLIDDCDYFVLLLGGRYGRLTPSGVSFPHLEYTYAVTKNKPIMVYYHANPEYLPEESRESKPEFQRKFDDFKALLSKETKVAWIDLENLKTHLPRTFSQFMKKHSALGWVRNGSAETQASLLEIEQLKQQIRVLMQGKANSRTPTLPEQQILKGDIRLEYHCDVFVKGDCKKVACVSEVKWVGLYSALAPAMLEPVSEQHMVEEINQYLEPLALKEGLKHYPKAHVVRGVKLSRSALNLVKVQLRAMGLIEKLPSGSGLGTFWKMTDAGDRRLTRLMTAKTF